MTPIDTLLFFSGGLDSTTALVKLLRETTYDLHVHFICYINRENRHDAEQEAVAKILPYCKEKFGAFETSRSVQDYREIGLPSDPDIVRFTAGQFCLKRTVRQVVAGRCKDDLGPGHSTRLGQADAIFNACVSRLAQKPVWFYPVADMTKQDEVAYLEQHAPELLDMIHCCRRPVRVDGRWANCNLCKTCRQMAQVNAESPAASQGIELSPQSQPQASQGVS